MPRKTSTIQVYVKDPDAFGEVIHDLGLNVDDSGKYRSHFEHAEYATLELTIAEDMSITGRVLPVEK